MYLFPSSLLTDTSVRGTVSNMRPDELFPKPLRRVTLIDEQVTRLNHIRERGGVNAMAKSELENLLSRMSSEAYNDTLRLIN